jgi:SAM-dependent methyltransferase
MLDKNQINYFNYQKVENKKFWKRLGGRPDMKGKTVLDFGCGYGALSLEIAQSEAISVNAIDLEEDALKFAKENLEENFHNLKTKVNFKKIDILENRINQKFDIIVSKDTFEHTQNLSDVLIKMNQLLNEGGKAYVGFGPLYNFYNGDHGRTEMYLPWFHLFFSDKFIINRINKKKKININRIQDLGLSKYSLKEYENFFKDSDFKIKYYITNQSDHPISTVFNMLSKFKLFREYCTYNIYCILEK